MKNQSTTVTRELVPEDQRLAVTAELFDIYFALRIEPVVYGITSRMTQGDYQGGYWQFYALNSDEWPAPGFYMAPDDDRSFDLQCDNYWSGELSADALGIVSCLYAYSHLSFGGPEPFARICAEHYHRLRLYMMEHAEVAAILGAID